MTEISGNKQIKFKKKTIRDRPNYEPPPVFEVGLKIKSHKVIKAQ